MAKWSPLRQKHQQPITLSLLKMKETTSPALLLSRRSSTAFAIARTFSTLGFTHSGNVQQQYLITNLGVSEINFSIEDGSSRYFSSTHQDHRLQHSSLMIVFIYIVSII
jgi:hypothetical protein